MKFGVREICDVVLKARSAMKVGNKIFYANEPVIYFDTLKTSSLEGASTTVYAQGGRGNTRLVAWEGERTVTFTMEDALISPEGFMILSGAGLIEANEDKGVTIKQHITETTNRVKVNKNSESESGSESESESGSESKSDSVTVYVDKEPYVGDDNNAENYIYVMLIDKNGEPYTEPYIPDPKTIKGYKYGKEGYVEVKAAEGQEKIDPTEVECWGFEIKDRDEYHLLTDDSTKHNISKFEGASVLVDYYTERTSNAKQIEITAESFGGNFYLEASTLFRNQDGVDLPAEFIVPNCKIQSNFTFTMASSGDPSTFTFTMDAFPAYTRFDNTKKVLAAIQIIEDTISDDMIRHSTYHEAAHDAKF